MMMRSHMITSVVLTSMISDRESKDIIVQELTTAQLQLNPADTKKQNWKLLHFYEKIYKGSSQDFL